jgi:uncharacterized membrane protein YfcA
MLVCLIFLFAGFIQGLSGFGSALLAMPLLTVFIDVKTAVPLCILNSLLMTSYLFLELKDYMERKKIFPLLLGSIPGIYIGVHFLINAEPYLIKILLGVLIVSYSVYSLVFNPQPRKLHSVWAYMAGFGTGFIGSAFSAGGPPSIIYTTLTGWSRDHIKATLTGFFFISSIITAAAHATGGLINTPVIKLFAVSAVFVLFGVYAGSRLYKKIDRQEYIRIILIILVILGLMLIISALVTG